MAVYYTAITLLLVAIRGTAAHDALGVSVGRALAAYWIGGVAGGAAWGLFLPLASTRLGSVVLGILRHSPRRSRSKWREAVAKPLIGRRLRS